jgi:hypothetical protein
MLWYFDAQDSWGLSIETFGPYETQEEAWADTERVEDRGYILEGIPYEKEVIL